MSQQVVQDVPSDSPVLSKKEKAFEEGLTMFRNDPVITGKFAVKATIDSKAKGKVSLLTKSLVGAVDKLEVFGSEDEKKKFQSELSEQFDQPEMMKILDHPFVSTLISLGMPLLMKFINAKLAPNPEEKTI